MNKRQVSGVVAVIVLGAAAPWVYHAAADDVTSAAAEYVETAATSELSAQPLDAGLVERIRRVQLLKRVDPRRVTSATLERLWNESTEGGLSASGAADAHRLRATEAVRKIVSGDCGGVLDAQEHRAWLENLAAPVPGAPIEASEEIKALATVLASSQVVHVTCERGELAAAMVQVDGRFLIVDLFPLRKAQDPTLAIGK